MGCVLVMEAKNRLSQWGDSSWKDKRTTQDDDGVWGYTALDRMGKRAYLEGDAELTPF